MVDISAADGREPAEDIDKIDAELRNYSPELSERPQIIVANKTDSADFESDSVKAFTEKAKSLNREVIYVSAVTGEGLDALVKRVAEKLLDLPPITVYETEILPEEDASIASAGVKETHIRKENGVYLVEGEWLYNFMGQINFNDYESLNFFQRVLVKNGVIDLLRKEGIEEGDTVSIYDFEFEFVF